MLTDYVWLLQILAMLMLSCGRLSFWLQLHAVQVDENEVSTGYQTPTSPPKSELALQKGFRRRTWTGPAWLDNVTSTGHVSHLYLLLLVPSVCCIGKNQISDCQLC